MKKYFIAIVSFVLIAFVLYNSVYFEKLDHKKEQDLKENFDPKEAVDYFWKNNLNEILKTAVNLESFDSLLITNPEYLIQKKGNSIGISSNYSFLVSGIVKTDGKNHSGIPIVLPEGNFKYNLILKFIFGNAARDAVSYFKVDDFENTMDFNAVAAELNSKILQKVIGNNISSLSSNTTIKFIGAVEINSENIQKELEIVPLNIEIIH